MQSDIVSSRGFLRAQVKSRMLRHAAELWGYSEAELEAFDPLVALLIEACAVEFEKISAEVSETQNRLLNRLAQLMNPEVDTARAAYGIIQVRSIEPASFVSPESQFTFRLRNADRNMRAADTEVFFSPIRKVPVFNASVQYMASSHSLFQIEEGIQKVLLAQGKPGYIAPHQTLWIGVDLDEDINSLQQMYLYFDWQMHPDREVWYKYLPFTEWYNGDQRLMVHMGLPEVLPSEINVSTLEKELDTVRKLEKETELQFENQFVTITSSSKPNRSLYPPELEQWVGQNALRVIRKPLCWIQIRFSLAISTETLDRLLCSVNAVPVINRKLNRLTYKLQPNFNIIPLESNGLFLGMREVKDGNSVRLQSVPLGNLLELQARTYTLQYGINRFDDRNAREMLTNMLDMVRDESSSFAALGEDFLSSVIRELNQTLARLEARVERDDILEEPIPYLVIKQAQQSENVFVEYWSCYGSRANRIPLGSKLSAYAEANVQKDKIYLLTTTQGGRDRLKASEKINHYRKALLSRNRIVTLEDVRAACYKELGEQIQTIDVRRSFMVDSAPNTGFLRCIEVLITPANPKGNNMDEWGQHASQLKTVLETQSVGNLPFLITIL